MAIADRAPGIFVLYLCVIVCVRALVLETLGRVLSETYFSKRRTLSAYYEKYSQNEKIFQSLVTGYVFREIFPPE
jgi:hypothetical protein